MNKNKTASNFLKGFILGWGHNYAQTLILVLSLGVTPNWAQPTIQSIKKAPTQCIISLAPTTSNFKSTLISRNAVKNEMEVFLRQSTSLLHFFWPPGNEQGTMQCQLVIKPRAAVTVACPDLLESSYADSLPCLGLDIFASNLKNQLAEAKTIPGWSWYICVCVHNFENPRQNQGGSFPFSFQISFSFHFPLISNFVYGSKDTKSSPSKLQKFSIVSNHCF